MSIGNTKLKCPICESQIKQIQNNCNCGYSPETDSISNGDALRSLYRKYKKVDWKAELKLVKRVNDFQRSKHYDWKLEKTAELLGLKESSKGQISEEIELIGWMDFDERLAECDNKSQAKKLLKRYKDFYPFTFNLFDSESELQNFITENWEQTPFSNEWDIYKPNFYAKKVGFIDILAIHRIHENSFHIIEIKKEKASIDKVIGQILRYMGWVKKHKTDDSGHIEGTIILGFPPDSSIEYALNVVQHLEVVAYIIEKGQVKFLKRDDELGKSLIELRDISFDDRLDIYDELKKKRM